MKKYSYHNYKLLLVLFVFIFTLVAANTNVLAAKSTTPVLIPKANLNIPYAAKQVGMAKINQKFYELAKEKVKAAKLHQKLMAEIKDYPVEKKIAAYMQYFQRLERRGYDLHKFMEEVKAYRQKTASPLEGTASITGTVTVEGNAPEEVVDVYAYDENGFFVTMTSTDFAGNYALSDLDAGSYFVVTQSSYVDEFYDDIPVDHMTRWRDATLVNVSDGQIVSGIDFDLLKGAIITGHFYEEDGITPISFRLGFINVFDAMVPSMGQSYFVFTGVMGEYEIHIPQIGSFKLLGQILGGGSEFYNNKSSWADADPVTISSYSDSIGNIDFSVLPEDTSGQVNFAKVSGSVMGVDGSPPILGLVFAFDLSDTSIAGLTVVGGLNGGPLATQQTPNYQIQGLPPGNYVFYANDYLGPYDGEYYQDAPTPDLATPVTLAEGDSVGGIDFTLPFGGIISGTITDDAGTPLDSVWVFAIKLDIQNFSAWFTESVDFGIGFSGPDGSYTIAGLSSGDYIVRTFSLIGPHGGEVVDEYYGGAQSIFAFDQAVPVTVTAPMPTDTIDFELDRAGAIIGNFYESDGTTPISGQGVVIPFDVNTGYPVLAITFFDSLTSSYTLAPLPSGNYILLALAGINTDSLSVQYVPQFYDGVYEVENATPVAVNAPVPTTGIDFNMEKPGTLQGVVFIAPNFPVGADSLSNTVVVAYDAASGRYRGSSSVTFAGGYRIGNLPPGNYQVCALPFSAIFAATYGGGGTMFGDPLNDIVDVAETDTSVEDITLQPGAGMIGGSITDQDGLNPLGGIGVLAFDTTGHITSMGISWPFMPMGNPIQPLNPGEYIIPGLVSGDYYVRTYSLIQLVYLLQSGLLNLPQNIPTLGAMAMITQPGRVVQEFDITLLADVWYPNIPVFRNVNLFSLLFRLLFTNQNFFPLFPFQQDIPDGAQPISVTSPGFVGGINFQLAPLEQVITGIDEEKARTIPSDFALHQNYPNPFNPVTHIAFEIPQQANIKIAIYNLLGQKVKTLVNEVRPAGHYIIQWNGTDDAGNSVSSGVYILRMEAAGQVFSQKMLLVR